MTEHPPTALLAFDFSLDHLDVALQGPDGAWPINHERYTNNWSGFQALKRDILLYLQTLDDVQLTAVGESSALYWWHAFWHMAHDTDLAAWDPQLVLLNPAHVKRFRRALPEADKTDATDPQLIGRYVQSVSVPHAYQFQVRYLPLRVLTRAYARLVHTLSAEKAYALTLIYLLGSEYQRQKPFSDLFGVASTHVLTEYPDLAAVAALDVAQLAEQLDAWSRGHLKDARATAEAVQHAAADSYPLPDALRSVVHAVLGYSLDLIRSLEAQQARLTADIRAQLQQLPEAQLALDLPGLGPILVAGCLSEIQATTRFTTGHKYDRRQKRWRDRTYRDGQAAVAKLAGLWWPRNSSGRFEGQERRLARERNPYLRYWFIQAAYSLRRHREEYAAYYQKKYDEATKHHHKRALVLTARKAVRLIFALLHKGQMQRLEEVAPD